MRHRKKFNHLGRKKAHRKAMLSNMAISLIEHKRINTTVAKAKALRSFVEPLINRSKTDTTHSRRMVFKRLQNKSAVTELFREISLKVAEREGGYTRILKTRNRLGDNAEMCIIELVDYNENYFSEKAAKSKRKRTRRGKVKTETTIEDTQQVEENINDVETKEEVKEENLQEEVKVEETKEETKEEIKDEVKQEEKADKEEETEDKKEDKE
ncbi:MAG: 50S ribosomal protein L17 [Bacteroidales bacterium]|nr:50S ribosomal protein L17 [Bacteroidales bacterium]